MTGRAHTRPLTILLLIGLGLCSPSAAVSADARTTAQGVYSTAQAEQGSKLHDRHCGKCHEPDDYQGSFLDAWEQVPVSVLYDVIELKMPEDRPGSLERHEYTALLAYIFQLNGLPSGDKPLSQVHEAMERIRITREP